MTALNVQSAAERWMRQSLELAEVFLESLRSGR